MTTENVKPALPPVTMMEIESMSPAEARVLIAKDALELLNAEAIIAKHDSYLLIPELENISAPLADIPMHEFLESAPTCRACALGTALIATVRRFDRLQVTEIFRDRYDANNDLQSLIRSRITRYLDKFFGQDQLDLMEIAFEGRAYGLRYWTPEEKKNAEMFHIIHSRMNPSELLKAIFKNIVDNNGTFTP